MGSLLTMLLWLPRSGLMWILVVQAMGKSGTKRLETKPFRLFGIVLVSSEQFRVRARKAMPPRYPIVLRNLIHVVHSSSPGYYNENTDKRNTFQVVVSDGTNPKFNGLGNNVCFCYGDMDWSTGSASGGIDGFNGVPATAGINRGISDNYVQMGRFGIPGDAYDGPGNATDGVDWLDFQGYVHPEDGATTSAVCFDARFNNIAPVVTGFPTEDKAIGTTCSDIGLEFSLTFATPEIDQRILVTLPTDLPTGMNLTMTESENAESIQVHIKWFPSTGQEGTYLLNFVAQDDFVVPAIVYKTLDIQVVRGTCGAEDPEDLPTMCVPVNETDCEGSPKPYCTPYRNPGKYRLL